MKGFDEPGGTGATLASNPVRFVIFRRDKHVQPKASKATVRRVMQTGRGSYAPAEPKAAAGVVAVGAEFADPGRV